MPYQMSPLATGGMPTVEAWLHDAEAARSIVFARKLDSAQALRALIKESVRLQLSDAAAHLKEEAEA